MLYEILYLIGASKESELDNIKNEVEKIVKDSGGEFLEKETMEKRRLSYTVNHESHGIYLAKRFELEKTENIASITNKINLNVNVLRFIISKARDLPELKSKEERMNEAIQKDSAQKNRSETKPLPQKEIKQNKKTKEKKTAKKMSSEDKDIDKKLEEILNI